MKSCPLCGGPAPDRPGFPGALPCDRCAGAIDVSRALENAGPVPRPRRRLPWPWIAGGAAVLVAGIGVGLLIPPRPETPKEEPRVDTGVLVGEARRRIESVSAGLTVPFDKAIDSWRDAEQLLDQAASLEPRRLETHLLLGKVHLARGAEGPAFAAFDRALELEPSNLEALTGKGERVVTSQLLLHLDRLRWPELTKALRARLAETQGRAFDALLRRLAAGSVEAAFAQAYAAVARADWAGAKRALDPVARSSLSDRLKDEIGYTVFAVDYLADPRIPPVGAWAGLIRGEEGAAVEVGERGVWLLLVKQIERKAFLSRLPVARSPRHPVHAGLLRAEASLHEAKGDPGTTLRVLGESIQAAPDYIQAHLAAAAALSKLGEAADAKRNKDAALMLATDWGLPAAVLQEIRE